MRFQDVPVEPIARRAAKTEMPTSIGGYVLRACGGCSWSGERCAVWGDGRVGDYYLLRLSGGRWKAVFSGLGGVRLLILDEGAVAELDHLARHELARHQVSTFAVSVSWCLQMQRVLGLQGYCS